jgi:hypothetical protein
LGLGRLLPRRLGWLLRRRMVRRRPLDWIGRLRMGCLCWSRMAGILRRRLRVCTRLRSSCVCGSGLRRARLCHPGLCRSRLRKNDLRGSNSSSNDRPGSSADGICEHGPHRAEVCAASVHDLASSGLLRPLRTPGPNRGCSSRLRYGPDHADLATQPDSRAHLLLDDSAQHGVCADLCARNQDRLLRHSVRQPMGNPACRPEQWSCSSSITLDGCHWCSIGRAVLRADLPPGTQLPGRMPYWMLGVGCWRFDVPEVHEGCAPLFRAFLRSLFLGFEGLVLRIILHS